MNVSLAQRRHDSNQHAQGEQLTSWLQIKPKCKLQYIANLVKFHSVHTFVSFVSLLVVETIVKLNKWIVKSE